MCSWDNSVTLRVGTCLSAAWTTAALVFGGFRAVPAVLWGPTPWEPTGLARLAGPQLLWGVRAN